MRRHGRILLRWIPGYGSTALGMYLICRYKQWKGVKHTPIIIKSLKEFVDYNLYFPAVILLFDSLPIDELLNDEILDSFLAKLRRYTTYRDHECMTKTIFIVKSSQWIYLMNKIRECNIFSCEEILCVSTQMYSLEEKCEIAKLLSKRYKRTLLESTLGSISQMAEHGFCHTIHNAVLGFDRDFDSMFFNYKQKAIVLTLLLLFDGDIKIIHEENLRGTDEKQNQKLKYDVINHFGELSLSNSIIYRILNELADCTIIKEVEPWLCQFSSNPIEDAVLNTCIAHGCTLFFVKQGPRRHLAKIIQKTDSKRYSIDIRERVITELSTKKTEVYTEVARFNFEMLLNAIDWPFLEKCLLEDKDDSGKGLLDYAVIAGNASFVEQCMIKCEIPLIIQEQYLVESIRYGHTGMCKRLLSLMTQQMHHTSLFTDNASLTGIAIESGSLEMVQYIVTLSIHTVKDADLFRAVQFGLKDVAKFLMRNGASPLIQNEKKQTILHIAAKLGDIDLVNWILSIRSELLNFQDCQGQCALYNTLYQGNIGISRLFLSFPRVDLRLLTSTKENILHAAVRSNKIDVVKILNDIDDDEFARLATDENDLGYSPLAFAVLNGNIEIVRVFIERKICPKENSFTSKSFPFAASDDYISIDTFLERLPFVSLLHCAICGFVKKISKQLSISAKIFTVQLWSTYVYDISQTSNDTILHKSDNETKEMCAILLDNFANGDDTFLHYGDFFHLTPLMYAILCCASKTARLLINRGSDLLAMDIYQQTVLHLCFSRADISNTSLILPKVKHLLYKCSADIAEGMQPLEYILTYIYPKKKAVIKMLKVNDVCLIDDNNDTILHRLARRKAKALGVSLKDPTLFKHLDDCLVEFWVELIDILDHEFPDLLATKNTKNDTVLWELLRYGKTAVAAYLFQKDVDKYVKCSNERSLLHAAVLSAETKAVELVLKEVPNLINVSDEDGNTPLMLAILENAVDIVSLLICTQQCDVMLINLNQMDALDLAIQVENIYLEDIIVKFKPELCEVNKGKSLTKLADAIYRGNTERMKSLLDMKYGIDMLTPKGENILHIAVQNRNTEAIFEILKRYPEKVNVPDSTQRTPFDLAVLSGENDVSQLILTQSQITLDTKVESTGITVVHRAVSSKSINMLKWTLGKYRHLLNECDATSKSPIFLSLETGFVDGFLHLLTEGADLYIRTIYGENILHAAVRSGLIDLIVEVVKSCPDLINSPNNDNITPVLMTESIMDFHIATYLLNCKADITWKSNKMENIAHLTLRYENYVLADYVLRVCPELMFNLTVDGMSPLHLCVTKNQKKLAIFITNYLHDNIDFKKRHGKDIWETAMRHHRYDFYDMLLQFISCDDIFTIIVAALHSNDMKSLTHAIEHQWHSLPEEDRNKILRVAVETGSVECAKYVSKKFNDISFTDEDGNNLLHYAVRSKSLPMVKYIYSLAKHLASIQNIHGETPVYRSVIIGKDAIIGYLLRITNANDCSSFDLIMPSILSGDYRIFKRIMKHYCTNLHPEHVRSLINTDYPVHGYPIFLAVRFGNRDMFKYLVKNGAICWKRCSEKGTILHAAIISRDLEMVKAVAKQLRSESHLDRFSEIMNACAAEDVTPLYNAVQCGYLEIAEYLIYRSKTDVKTTNGSTLLHAAVQSSNVMMVELICEAVPKLINEPNQAEETPLFKAILNNQKEMTDILEQKGADPYKLREDGATIVHMAVCTKNVNAVSRIINRYTGLLDKPSHDGLSPFLLAVKNGNMDIIECFVDSHAKKDFHTEDGTTILNCAVQSGSLDVVKFIVVLLNKYDNPPVLITNYEQNNILEQEYPSVDVTPCYAYSCILESINLNHFDITSFLLDCGKTNGSTLTDPWHVRNELGRNILHEVAVYGSFDALKYVLDNAPELIHESDMFGFKPIHLALDHNKIDLFKCLYDLSNDCRFMATFPQVMEIFLTDEECANSDEAEQGLSIEDNRQTKNRRIIDRKEIIKRWNPLHQAVKLNNLECCEMIIEQNMDFINDRNEDDCTALGIAVSAQNIPIVTLLLNHGADPDIICADGKNLLHQSVLLRNIDLTKLLLKANPRLANTYDNFGFTPLRLATMNQCSDEQILMIRQHSSHIIELASFVHRKRHLIHYALFNIKLYLYSLILVKFVSLLMGFDATCMLFLECATAVLCYLTIYILFI